MNSIFLTLCLETTLFQAWKKVKEKGSSGGIDGMSIQLFEENSFQYIKELSLELKSRKWVPQPYKRISIPKKKNEFRKLGLLSIRDKIVQQAIKDLIEDKIDKGFVSNSYGYRQNRGHAKAVRRAFNEIHNKSNLWILKLDIDNYFDTIDHEILQKRLSAIITEDEIVRLIMLCVKMGCVGTDGKWEEIKIGIPQGAVISPLLANLYLHSFDQFVLSKTSSYVRYADDFIILTHSKDEADELLQKGSEYLSQKLKLKLNEPHITETCDGVHFLGVDINLDCISISNEKYDEIIGKIKSIKIVNGSFSEESVNSWSGILRYYAPLLQQDVLFSMDVAFQNNLLEIVQTNPGLFSTKQVLVELLSSIKFVSNEGQLKCKDFINAILSLYDESSKVVKSQEIDENKKVINQRKLEYRKKESEGSELVISTPGAFIGISNGGLSIKSGGKCIHKQKMLGLKHVTIISPGVSLSSNVIFQCMSSHIPVDFFDSRGKHYASVLSPDYIESTLWAKQAEMDNEKRMKLAHDIIEGKIKNQHNLMKYYNKYHKKSETTFPSKFDMSSEKIKAILDKMERLSADKWHDELTGYESQAAISYWAYVRFLLVDDNISFENRERKGAKDLFNSMLNYGYSFLYVRIWEALLGAGLNPYHSIIHVPQDGKPTFVFDVIELFRAQAVDRVIIGLVQKDIELKIKDGWLDENTKSIVSKAIIERFQRYEKFRGEEMTFEKIIHEQVAEIADFISGKGKFKAYLAKW